MYDAEAVLNPDFRLAPAEEKGAPCRDLFMQTFFSIDEPDGWLPEIDSKWHRLARILPDRIVTFPVYTNPHAQRYLTRRHGRIKTIIYEMDSHHVLPESEDAARMIIERHMQQPVWNDCSFGLGMTKDLDPIWTGLIRLPDIDTIVVTRDGTLEIDGYSARIPRQHLDEMRRLFNKANRKLRERMRLAKQWHVRNELLAKLAPQHFPAFAQVTTTGELMEYRMVGTRPYAAVERQQRQASVKSVRENAKQIAKEAPHELIALHAEIERVTLATMIERFEKKLEQSLTEDHWQSFFQENVFILSLLFARPVQLLHTQFHAQGSQLDGSGAQVGDFLFREFGQSLAIIEIKRPTSPLMRAKSYRNNKVYGPHADLSGAITQVLYQQTALHSNWLYHQGKLKDSLPDTIKCVVISGTTPADEEQRRCFDIFRHACKDVDVVTFDELLGKLKLSLQHLTPKPPEEGAQVPF